MFTTGGFTLRVLRRFFVAVLAIGMLGGTGATLSAPPSAHAQAACGAVLVSGGSWLGGGGVNVYSNGASQGSGYSCAGTGAYGYQYQCVELAARLYAIKGWGRVYAQDGGAHTIPEGSPALTFHPNGSGYTPVPGDLIIENATSYNWAGHVAVVN